MNSITGTPVTAAIFAALTILLTGCIAYDAFGPAADAGPGLTAGDVLAAR